MGRPRRKWLVGFPLSAVLGAALAALSPSLALVATTTSAGADTPACTDSWTGGARDDLWTTAGNWSGCAHAETDVCSRMDKGVVHRHLGHRHDAGGRSVSGVPQGRRRWPSPMMAPRLRSAEPNTINAIGVMDVATSGSGVSQVTGGSLVNNGQITVAGIQRTRTCSASASPMRDAGTINIRRKTTLRAPNQGTLDISTGTNLTLSQTLHAGGHRDAHDDKRREWRNAKHD